MLLTAALGTESLDDVVHRKSLEAFGEHHAGDMYLLQTKGALARFAAEMNMQVVVGGTDVATEFVLHTITAILDDMDQMSFAEKGKGTEEVAAVNGIKQLLQLTQGEGMSGLSQLTQHADAIGRGLHLMLLQVSRRIKMP